MVLNLGCGLDTRSKRITCPDSVKWFDVDFPEVIEFREQFFSNTDNYKMIKSSVTGKNWLTEIATGSATVIVAEGLLEYLNADQVKDLFDRLTDNLERAL